ncbi:MAG: hypothetical protein AAF958_05290 [Planctomycetota bacterium]
MTVEESACRDRQTLDRIENALRFDHLLQAHSGHLRVSKAAGAVVVTGHLPSPKLREAIVPMIRRAGVVDRVENKVLVS